MMVRKPRVNRPKGEERRPGGWQLSSGPARALAFEAIGPQQAFRVPVGLLPPLEYEGAGRRERDAVDEITAHGDVARVAGILLIDDFGHAPQGLHYLLLAADAVAQPVRHVLARDAQSRAILHETDVMDVRHF